MNIKCDCGKKMVVSDALAGKSVRCPTCGESIFVAASQPGTTAGNTKPAKATGFYMSLGMMIGIVSVALLLVAGLGFYFGPMRVGRQWSDMNDNARGTVNNVITYALKAYLSQRGEFDPSHHAPAMENGDIIFNPPVLAMSMPKKIKFDGNSNNGAFTGFYNTETGDVEADVEYGGVSVAGIASLKKPAGRFHMTGHEENKNAVVTVDGQAMKIIYPTKETGKY